MNIQGVGRVITGLSVVCLDECTLGTMPGYSLGHCMRDLSHVGLH